MKTLFLTLLLCWAMSPVFANSEIRLVTGDDYPPFTDREIPDNGLAVSLFRAIFETQGITAKFDWKPWKRGYLEAKVGKYSGTFPYRKSLARETDFLFSAPVFYLQEVIVTRKKEKRMPENYGDLEDMTICLPDGYAAGKGIEALLKRGEIDLFRPKNMDGCFKAIMYFDKLAIKTHKYLAYYEIRERNLNPDDFNISKMPGGGYTLHLIVPKVLPEAQKIIETFNVGLKAIKQSGEFTRISEKFGVK